MLRSTCAGAGVAPAQLGMEHWAADDSLNPYKAHVLLTLLLSSGRTRTEAASLQQVTDRY